MRKVKTFKKRSEMFLALGAIMQHRSCPGDSDDQLKSTAKQCCCSAISMRASRMSLHFCSTFDRNGKANLVRCLPAHLSESQLRHEPYARRVTVIHATHSPGSSLIIASTSTSPVVVRVCLTLPVAVRVGSRFGNIENLRLASLLFRPATGLSLPVYSSSLLVVSENLRSFDVLSTASQ